MRAWVFLLMISLLPAACSNNTPPQKTDDRTFKLGLIPGAQEFVDFVMEGHGLLPGRPGEELVRH